MSDVDLSKIRKDDRVRVSFLGLEGWQDVIDSGHGNALRCEPLHLPITHCDLVVLEHKPAPVKIEVELPEPKAFSRWGSLTARMTTGGPKHIVVGKRIDLVTLLPSEAEEYALAILALVHEARS